MSDHGIGVAYGSPKRGPTSHYWCVCCNSVRTDGALAVCVDCAALGFEVNPGTTLAIQDRVYTPSGNHGVKRPSKRLEDDDPYWAIAYRAMEDRG